MTNREKADKSILQAVDLLRNKPVNSTLVERHFLLQEAWERVKGLPQPVQMGKGLRYVLERASLPVEPFDLLLGRHDDHVPTEEEEARLQALWSTNFHENPIIRLNGGHFSMNTETVLRDGIPGILQRIRNRLAGEREEEKRIFLQGMELVFESIRVYMARYADAAEKAGLSDCAEVCRALCSHAPETFREGLQLILFIYIVYLIYAGAMVACLSLGRLDDLLLPLYENDISEGRLTEEEAGCLIDDFSAKMSLHLGRGEHQMAGLSEDYVQTGWTRNPVYESPGYIVIGGYSHRTACRDNPLTLLFARHIHPELKNPVYVCRYAKGNDALWEILSEKIRDNASLLLYNDETVIPAYRHIGIAERDAVDYSVHPCNWADIGGGSAIIGQVGEPLPVLLQKVLHENPDAADMEAVFCAAQEAYGKLIRDGLQRELRRVGQNKGLLSMSDCLTDGGIESGLCAVAGGAKYRGVYTLLRNIGTAGDMLSAVEELVFRQKKYSLRQLLQAAEADFEGFAQLHYDVCHAPKYGTDDDRADALAAELMGRLLDVIDREMLGGENKTGIFPVNVTINDSNHLWDGAKLGATVDGRRKGAPLTENLSGTVGHSKGVTALLKSAAKLPFERIHSGALNLRLSKSLFAGEDGAKRIKALLDAYFLKGGMQLQFSFTDTAELRTAQENPDAYRDLLVRITGYSAIFVDMSHGAQEEFIRREELR